MFPEKSTAETWITFGPGTKNSGMVQLFVPEAAADRVLFNRTST